MSADVICLKKYEKRAQKKMKNKNKNKIRQIGENGK
jgi:hypothetical protein